MSSVAPELARCPKLLDEVFLTLSSDNGRSRVGNVTGSSSPVLSSSFWLDNINAIGELLFVGSVVDASSSSSPHPAQETAFLPGMDRSGVRKSFGVILQKGTPRNAPRWEPRDRSRAFGVMDSIFGGVDQPNGQCGDRRRGGRVCEIRGMRTLHTLGIRRRRGGSGTLAQSSVGMDRNWFEAEACGRYLLPFDPVTASVDSRVREEGPLRVRIGSGAHVRRVARKTWGALDRRGSTRVPLCRRSASGSRRAEANRGETFDKSLNAR